MVRRRISGRSLRSQARANSSARGVSSRGSSASCGVAGHTTHHADTTGWFSSRRLKLAHTGYKTLTEEGTGRLLGAHLLGSHAEEIINIFALAIRHQLPASDLSHMVYSYPTSASDISSML